MEPLSPVDAISPAFSRTRTILTPPGPVPGQPTPFRFWFFLKIAVIAALTQGNIYAAVFAIFFDGIFFSMMLTVGFRSVRLSDAPFAVAGGLSPFAVAAFAVAVFFALAVILLLCWIWCRVRFTLFDLVLYRRGLVGRAWSPYASQAWRFLGLMLLIGLALLLILAVTVGPLLIHLIALIRHLTPQQLNADPSIFFAHILPMYGMLFLFALLAGLVNAVTQDFILPPMALEDAPLEFAFGRFFHLLRTRFWYVALYMLLRFVLELGLSWIGMIAVFVVLAILGVGGAGIGFVLYRAFWHAGPGGGAIFVLYCIVAGLAILAVYLLLITLVYGVVAVVKQCYAAYFYGSYYPLLGDRLEPPAPVTPDPVPPVPIPPAAILDPSPPLLPPDQPPPAVS
jgi:hypothetical protein